MRLVEVPKEMAARHNYQAKDKKKTTVYSKDDEYKDAL
jgi:hypothetical protein